MCIAFENVPHVAPGWGCCNCKTYNVGALVRCKYCGRARCVADTGGVPTELRPPEPTEAPIRLGAMHEAMMSWYIARGYGYVNTGEEKAFAAGWSARATHDGYSDSHSESSKQRSESDNDKTEGKRHG